jgi:hypothetical protein
MKRHLLGRIPQHVNYEKVKVLYTPFPPLYPLYPLPVLYVLDSTPRRHSVQHHSESTISYSLHGCIDCWELTLYCLRDFEGMPYCLRLALGTCIRHDGKSEILLIPSFQPLPHQSHHSSGDASQYPLLKPMIRVRIITFI